jgi:hypothetical protein
MLLTMRQPASAAPSPTPAGFAGLLTALIAPAPKTAQEKDADWNDDLADDIATLSYESAMRSHARYRAPAFDDRSLAQAAAAMPAPVDEVIPAKDTLLIPASVQAASVSRTTSEPESASQPARQFERNRKSASVTIRMSEAEYTQLQERAAEAGITVSAYLRSCTFEAESLRAQVKETLALLRPATTSGNLAAVPAKEQIIPPPAERSRLGWLRRGRLK